MDAIQTQNTPETTETTEKALFEKLLHGPKVARILAKVASDFGFDGDEAKALFEQYWTEDEGRVRVPRVLSEAQIDALASYVKNQTPATRDAAKASLGVKSEATLNSLCIKHASRLLS